MLFRSGDPRESPATKVMELMQKDEAKLSFADPFTPSLVLNDIQYKAQEITPALLAECDCALILTAHSAFDYDMIVQHAPLVFDTRNGTKGVKGHSKENVNLLS